MLIMIHVITTVNRCKMKAIIRTKPKVSFLPCPKLQEKLSALL